MAHEMQALRALKLRVELPDDIDRQNAVTQPVYSAQAAEYLRRRLSQFEAVRTRGDVESRSAYLGTTDH